MEASWKLASNPQAFRDFAGQLWHYRQMSGGESFFKRQIDWTDFGTVRRYVETPGTEISEALVVDPSIPLEQAAAIAYSGNADTWVHLIETGKVTIASKDTPNETRCRVIYLPPAYLVQFPDAA